MASPIFYPRDFINIHTCSADRRNRRVYYVRPPPPQNVIASYAYVKSRLQNDNENSYTEQ